MTRRKGVAAEDDTGMQALRDAKTEVVTIVGKSSDLHVTEVLARQRRGKPGHDPRNGRLSAGRGPARHLRRRTFLRRLEQQPRICPANDRRRPEGGAEIVVLCDTNGGSMPERDRAGVDAAKRGACRADRHPLPQRLRRGDGQFAHRRSARRCSGAGDHQWHRRALRKRRPDRRDCQPGPQGTARGPRARGRRSFNRALALRVRDRQHELPGEPGLRGNKRLCPQGGHARPRRQPPHRKATNTSIPKRSAISVACW